MEGERKVVVGEVEKKAQDVLKWRLLQPLLYVLTTSVRVWQLAKFRVGTKADYWTHMQEKHCCAFILMLVPFVGEKTEKKKKKKFPNLSAESWF